jgi:hypothetical protein
MDFEQALAIANQSVAQATGRSLTTVEIAILQGAWFNQTYEQIADFTSYSPSYLSRTAAPQLWQLLSNALGETVGKKTVRLCLEGWGRMKDEGGGMKAGSSVPLKPDSHLSLATADLVSDPATVRHLDVTQILLDLQRSNEIAQALSNCFEPEEIARRVTTGMLEKFDCNFARLWLLEPNQTILRLVASSGLSTNLNGRFARVPVGAYKVGKIAQNRIAFLSNNLSNESWVSDRTWAIANQIRGFAGYPLVSNHRVVGVMAIFSQQEMAPEFLEVLQMLCTTTAIAIDTALSYQKEKKQALDAPMAFGSLFLSDQLATLLHETRLTLLGTERPLPPPITITFMQMAEILHQLNCISCRLIYSPALVVLDAMIPLSEGSTELIQFALNSLKLSAAYLGGKLHTQIQANQRTMQIALEVSHQPLPPVDLTIF